MTYLINKWYAAAWAEEIGDAPQARTIMDKPVVLYRIQGGSPVALADRCCHRALPLSLGQVIGDDIRCGYHGLRFDAAGQCVDVPGQTTIPPGARVDSYPVVERHRMVWIWMGDPALANSDDIPNLYWHDDPGWVSTGEHIEVCCDYRLLIDIQLDATHVTFVHASTLGSDAVQATPPEVIRDDDTLQVRRWMLDVAPPPIWVSAGGFTGNVDRWILATYMPPSLCAFDIGAAVAGTGAPEGERGQGITNRTTHFMTPASANSTHYFWLFARNYGLDDEALSERVHAAITETFHEDVEIVERQGRSIAADRIGTQIDVNADRPTVQARRLLERLIAEEAEQGTKT